MIIKGFIKSSFVDFPDDVCSVIFLAGCNFRCPYCHNSDLVISNSSETIGENEVFEFLEKRKRFINTVCITGGEPTLKPDLICFIKKLKNKGFNIKLDTNGTNPKLLKELLMLNLVDYIAMDVKNSLTKYEKTTGVHTQLNNIMESITLIKDSDIDYEFRTTIIKDFHSKEDILEIAKLLKRCKHFSIQQYKYSENQLVKKRYSTYSKEELMDIKNSINLYIDNVTIKGADN